MNDTYRTVNQAYQNDILPIQSYVVPHINIRSPDGVGSGYVSQEWPNSLNNDNIPINGSVCTQFPSYGGNETHSANINESISDATCVVFSQQTYPPESQQIQMKSKARGHYHLRTQKENHKASHFIRSAIGEQEEHPSIYTNRVWKSQSTRNYIEVALVGTDYELHPYIINYKEKPSTNDQQQTVFRQDDNAPNILLFLLTDGDFDAGHKAFKIELNKCKQNDYITKEEIRRRQLNKSMFRFTRTFYDKENVYHRDEASTAYSCEMTEKYCDVTVHHINPRYGPMGGNQKLSVVFKGLKAEDREKLSFEIVEQNKNWKIKITQFYFVGNTIYFSMPIFPYPSNDDIMTSVLVYYEGEAIDESPFVYSAALDEILNKFSLNEPIQTDTAPTTSNNKISSKQDSASSSSSLSTGIKKTPKTNRTKRQRTN